MDWLTPLFSKRLGPLESDLLRALWQRGDATVRELIDDTHSDAAYTTVMTTLDRLYKKGLLDRSAERTCVPVFSTLDANGVVSAASGQFDAGISGGPAPSAELLISSLIEAWAGKTRRCSISWKRRFRKSGRPIIVFGSRGGAHRAAGQRTGIAATDPFAGRR